MPTTYTNAELAEAMAVNGSQPTGNSAFYTYFGQFIAHDIVPETNGFNASRVVTPEMNLDSIYGTSNYLDLKFKSSQNRFITDNRFLLQTRTQEVADIEYSVKDFVRLNSTFKGRVLEEALIPEERNDENIIVAQLQILFMRFHNALITAELARNAAEAMKILTILYQLIAVDEFLKRFISEEIYTHYFDGGKSLYPHWNKGQVPTFFSHAAFRFGHSMVRKSYKIIDYINKKTSISLSDLFNKRQKLHPKHAVNFENFFSIDDENNKALLIDTNLSNDMQSVGFTEVDVIKRNIDAGTNANLPLGLEFYYAVKREISKQNLVTKLKFKKVSNFGKSNLKSLVGLKISEIPLWPYLLLEAETLKGGKKLGPLGSVLVAEVFRNAISNSDISIYEKGTFNKSRTLKIVLDKLSNHNHWNRPESAGKPIILLMNEFVELNGE